MTMDAPSWNVSPWRGLTRSNPPQETARSCHPSVAAFFNESQVGRWVRGIRPVTDLRRRSDELVQKTVELFFTERLACSVQREERLPAHRPANAGDRRWLRARYGVRIVVDIRRRG